MAIIRERVATVVRKLQFSFGDGIEISAAVGPDLIWI